MIYYLLIPRYIAQDVDILEMKKIKFYFFNYYYWGNSNIKIIIK